MKSLRIKNNKGVSLVELIVVMAILAILAAVAIVGYSAFIRRAKQSKAEQELTQVYNLIYMQADQQTIEIGQNSNLETALFVTTSGNKIVLMFNDVPTKTISESEWDYDNIDHWEHEDYWNDLLRELIDEVTGDIKMFSGVFELDPKELTAEIGSNGSVEVVEKRNITYILEKDESLRSKKELIVTTINDVETITRFLNDLEATKGKLVPSGRVVNDGEVEEIIFEIWFVWTAAAGYVLSDELSGDLNIVYDIYLLGDDTLTGDDLISANNKINGDGDPTKRLFNVIVERSTTIKTDYPDYLIIKLSFNREPDDQYEYELIQNYQVILEFTITIENIELIK